MKKFAFIFPGQGSQTVGMLSDILEKYQDAKQVFQDAQDVLGYDLLETIQHDPHNNLNLTEFTQPAILAASIAIAYIISKHTTLKPVAAAGHSLGEFSAFCYTQGISFKDCIKLVKERGALMQRAIPTGVGAMAAIIGLSQEKINDICQQIGDGKQVNIANLNSKEQTVISGYKEAVEQAMSACKDAGAKRAIALPVSIPSHSNLMQEAAQEFSTLVNNLTNLQLSTEIQFYQDVTAQVPTSLNELKDNLIKQMYSSVNWVGILDNLAAQGIDTLIEVGPGKVLTNLAKRLPGVTCYSTNNLAELEKTIEFINNEA